jgi:hypothetical protein
MPTTTTAAAAAAAAATTRLPRDPVAPPRLLRRRRRQDNGGGRASAIRRSVIVLLSLYIDIYSLSIEDRLLTQISLTRLLFIVGPFRAGLLRDSLFFLVGGRGPLYLPSYLLAMDAQNVGGTDR